MRIPIKTARELGQAFDFDQVIIMARNSRTNMQHVTTWGSTRELCDETALVANDIKAMALGWPPEAIKPVRGHRS